LGKNAVPAIDLVEMIPRAAVLGGRPHPYCGIIAVLQPAVFIHHIDTMIGVTDRMMVAGAIWSGGWECE
jgi:hypothetical protein